MSDWDDACDPVQPLKDRAQRKREQWYATRRKREQKLGLAKSPVAAVPSHFVDRDFDEEA